MSWLGNKWLYYCHRPEIQNHLYFVYSFVRFWISFWFLDDPLHWFVVSSMNIIWRRLCIFCIWRNARPGFHIFIIVFIMFWCTCSGDSIAIIHADTLIGIGLKITLSTSMVGLKLLNEGYAGVLITGIGSPTPRPLIPWLCRVFF